MRDRWVSLVLSLLVLCARSVPIRGAEYQLDQLGTPIAAVTAPTGGGNHDIEVIRDGVKPATTVGTNAGDSALQ